MNMNLSVLVTKIFNLQKKLTFNENSAEFINILKIKKILLKKQLVHLEKLKNLQQKIRTFPEIASHTFRKKIWKMRIFMRKLLANRIFF